MSRCFFAPGFFFELLSIAWVMLYEHNTLSRQHMRRPDKQAQAIGRQRTFFGRTCYYQAYMQLRFFLAGCRNFWNFLPGGSNRQKKMKNLSRRRVRDILVVRVVVRNHWHRRYEGRKKKFKKNLTRDMSLIYLTPEWLLETTGTVYAGGIFCEKRA